MLRQLTKPLCAPITLDQARKHLAVDASDRTNDTLIELLIEAATSDSQMKTGRIWVESDWEWIPDSTEVGVFMNFPIVPVVAVKLYDMTPPPEPEEPEEPADPDNPPVEGGGGENEGNEGGTDIETRRLVARQKARLKREATETPPEGGEPPIETPPSEDEPTEPEWPEVSAEYLEIELPSLDPMGNPAIGNMLIKQTLPEKWQLVLTVGYPVESHTELKEQFDNPTLVLDKTGYTDGIIRLVFNRPVDGVISIENFEVRKKYIAPPETPPDEGETPDTPPTGGEDTGGSGEETPEARSRRMRSIASRVNAMADEGTEGDSGGTEEPPVTPPEEPPVGGDEEEEEPKDEIITLEDAYFIDGAIEIQYAKGALTEGDTVILSFFEGDAHDEFDNFVQPIVLQELPAVKFMAGDGEMAVPEPVPEEEVYESLAPNPIKNWILTRVGSLYSQRTEIALRAGKSNDAMFPDQFINNLLDPFRVRFFDHVR